MTDEIRAQVLEAIDNCIDSLMEESNMLVSADFNYAHLLGYIGFLSEKEKVHFCNLVTLLTLRNGDPTDRISLAQFLLDLRRCY